MGRSPNPATGGTGGRHGSPWRAAGFLLVVLLALAGVSMVIEAATAPGPPPQPAPAPPRSEAAGTGGPEIAIPDTPAGSAVALDRSHPTRIRIPRIGVDTSVMGLGVDDQGMVEVPPLEAAHLAGWYNRGPSPGEAGNSVIVGHLDSYAMGPAVFYRLGALAPGDEILVERQDGRTVRFRVERVESHPTEAFPHDLVYGPAPQSQLRLVTCGGTFDEKRNAYPDNVIVFASAVAVDPPPRGSTPTPAPAPAPTPTPTPTPSLGPGPEQVDPELRELLERLTSRQPEPPPREAARPTAPPS